MTSTIKKVILLGASAVGKTSLVHRYKQGSFDERYQTTIGVQIEEMNVTVDGRAVTLILWDLEGSDDPLHEYREIYMSGADGYVLVVDGTRPVTLDIAKKIQQQIETLFQGEPVPFVALLNKRDLTEKWRLHSETSNELSLAGWTVYETSAKTGKNVHEAFETLVNKMLALDERELASVTLSLETMEPLILQYIQESGDFQVEGSLPDWVERFVEQPLPKGWNPSKFLNQSHFLQGFLQRATRFWDENESGRLPSGAWEESSLSGEIYDLQAEAVSSGTKKFMRIWRPDPRIRDQIQAVRTGLLIQDERPVASSQTIFISYSHKDERWKDRLVTHLSVLEGKGHLDIWHDRRIEAGEDWKSLIDTAITRARIAILIVSADFLSSRFIRTEEIPRLLLRRKEQGLSVIPVIVSPCAWTQVEWLAAIQVRSIDGRPLSLRPRGAVDTELTSIAVEIASLLKGNS